jgi:hypothetical protein
MPDILPGDGDGRPALNSSILNFELPLALYAPRFILNSEF